MLFFKKYICSVQESAPDIFTLAHGVYEISFWINKQSLKCVGGQKGADLWKLLGGPEKKREKGMNWIFRGAIVVNLLTRANAKSRKRAKVIEGMTICHALHFNSNTVQTGLHVHTALIQQFIWYHWIPSNAHPWHLCIQLMYNLLHLCILLCVYIM